MYVWYVHAGGLYVHVCDPKHIWHNILLNIFVLTILYLPCHDKTAGGRLNKKDGLTRYGDSHVKDKTS